MVAAAARRLGRLIDQAIADRLAEAGEGLGLVLEDLRPGRWEALPQPASGALSAVLDAAAACRTGLGGERREEPDAAAGRKIAQAALEEVLDTTARLLKAFDEPDPAKRYDVVWLAEVGADRHKVLHAAPLWVGGLLRERLFGRSTVVLTSATLALGGNFDALARQWGLPPGRVAHRRPGARSRGPEVVGAGCRLAVRARQERHPLRRQPLPPPGRDGLPPAYLDEIAGLVEAAGGRTLGLFSSMRAAKQATEALRDRLATPLLCQGDDATMLLVKRFAEDDETSLFGTLSLWQGVDVPGPSLSCVIIDRIPFPRPDDPLVVGPPARGRLPRRQRLPAGLGHPRRAPPGAGGGQAAARDGRPRRGRDPRPPPGHRPLRRLPPRLPPAVLADGRPGEGPRGPAPPARRLSRGSPPRVG